MDWGIGIYVGKSASQHVGNFSGLELVKQGRRVVYVEYGVSTLALQRSRLRHGLGNMHVGR